MVASCSVPGCKTKHGAQDLGFHLFPLNNQELLKQWCILLKMKRIPSKTMVVCSKHFKDDDYKAQTAAHYIKVRRRLLETAVPSLNLPNESVPDCKLFDDHEVDVDTDDDLAELTEESEPVAMKKKCKELSAEKSKPETVLSTLELIHSTMDDRLNLELVRFDWEKKQKKINDDYKNKKLELEKKKVEVANKKLEFKKAKWREELSFRAQNQELKRKRDEWLRKNQDSKLELERMKLQFKREQQRINLPVQQHNNIRWNCS